MIRCELQQEIPLGTVVPGGHATVTDTSPDLDLPLDGAPALVADLYALGGFTPAPPPPGRERGRGGRDGASRRPGTTTGIYSRECDAMSPVRAWHRSYEARAIAAAGFVTGRMLKAARV